MLRVITKTPKSLAILLYEIEEYEDHNIDSKNYDNGFSASMIFGLNFADEISFSNGKSKTSGDFYMYRKKETPDMA